MKKKDWLVFSIFLLLTFVLRLSSLFQSMLEGDESLYLLVASNLIHGHPPYTVVWDNKPLGIYLLFSLALVLLGNSILSLHIFACITIAVTSYLLYRLGKVIGSNNFLIGLLAGILYVIYSIQTDDIIGINTEFFFTPFVTLAFYLIFAKINAFDYPINPNTSNLFTIGLLLGIALQIKQVVIFDLTALIIILIINLFFQNQRISSRKSLFISTIKLCIPLLIGLLIPFFITLVYFLINGHFSDYVYANFLANIIRIESPGFTITSSLQTFKEQIIRNFLLWLCLCLVPFCLVLVKETEPEEKRNVIYITVWFFVAFLSIWLLKSAYDHYYLQLLPPLCIISSYVIIRSIRTVGELDKNRRLLVLALILFQPFFTNTYPHMLIGAKYTYFRFVKGIPGWGDSDTVIVAKYLQKQVKKEDYIYSVDLPVFIYFLVDAKIPTKYAFPGFLNDKKLQKVAGVNSLKELNFIMLKKPTYVIRRFEPAPAGPTYDRDDKFYAAVDSYLQKNYIFNKQIGDVKVYKLR